MGSTLLQMRSYHKGNMGIARRQPCLNCEKRATMRVASLALHHLACRRIALLHGGKQAQRQPA